jgi:hypothetical protein
MYPKVKMKEILSKLISYLKVYLSLLQYSEAKAW